MKKPTNMLPSIQLLLMAGGVAVGLLVGVLTKGGVFAQVNLQISHSFQSLQPLWLIRVNQAISSLEIGIVLIVLPVCLYLMKKGEKRAAALLLAAGISWLLMRLLKTLFGIPCPTAADVQLLYAFHNIESSVSTISRTVRFFDPDVCYPSGHVFDFTMVWGTLFLIRHKLTNNTLLQRMIACVAITLVFLIGQSRISLGAHWFTDVIGGYMFGFAWLLLLRELFFSKRKRMVR